MIVPKRLELLPRLLPEAARVAVLANPRNAGEPQDRMLARAQESARVMGLTIHIIEASTSREIDDAFTTMA